MCKPNRVALFSFILFFVFAAPIGCGKAKPSARKTPPVHSGAGKRVMVLPFINNSGLGEEASLQMTARFVELLGKSGNVTLQAPPKDMAMPADISSPQYGIVTPLPLVKKAEAMHLDALITGVLDPVAGITKRSGIWPFRATRRTYEVSAMINVVHVPSRTVLLTKLESENISLAVDKKVDERVLAGKALNEAMPSVVEPLASAAAKSLAQDLSQRIRHHK